MSEQAAEMQSLLTEIKSGWSGVSQLPAEVGKLSGEMKEVRRALANRARPRPRRLEGQVSDDCARHMAATFILHCERSGKLEALSSVNGQRDSLIQFARNTLDIGTRTALTTSDMGLPTQFTSEIRELISEFGVVRQCMSYQRTSLQ